MKQTLLDLLWDTVWVAIGFLCSFVVLVGIDYTLTSFGPAFRFGGSWANTRIWMDCLGAIGAMVCVYRIAKYIKDGKI